MQLKTLKAAVEAVIFASTEPINEKTLMDITDAGIKEIRWALQELMQEYESQYRGIQLTNLAEGFVFTTKMEYSEWVEKLLAERKAAPLSYAAMETLAIIAYKQPVTRGEIERIRGVNADRTVQTLVERQLVKEIGRLDSPGRPITYGTTKDFLINFGLPDLNHLPPLLEEISADSVENEIQEDG